MSGTSRFLERLRAAILTEVGFYLTTAAEDDAEELGYAIDDVLEVLLALEPDDLDRQFLGRSGVPLFAFVVDHHLHIEIEIYVKLADHTTQIRLVSFHQTDDDSKGGPP